MEPIIAFLIVGSVLGVLSVCVAIVFFVCWADEKRNEKERLAKRYGKSTMTHNMLEEK